MTLESEPPWRAELCNVWKVLGPRLIGAGIPWQRHKPIEQLAFHSGLCCFFSKCFIYIWKHWEQYRKLKIKCQCRPCRSCPDFLEIESSIFICIERICIRIHLSCLTSDDVDKIFPKLLFQMWNIIHKRKIWLRSCNQFFCSCSCTPSWWKRNGANDPTRNRFAWWSHADSSWSKCPVSGKIRSFLLPLLERDSLFTQVPFEMLGQKPLIFLQSPHGTSPKEKPNLLLPKMFLRIHKLVLIYFHQNSVS